MFSQLNLFKMRVSSRPLWRAMLTQLVEKLLPPCMPWRSCRSTRPKRSRNCTRVVRPRGYAGTAYSDGPRPMGDESQCTLPGSGDVHLSGPGAHLWLNLADMHEPDKVRFLNALHKLVQDVNAIVCSDRPEGCVLSCLDSPPTQAIPTVCVRGLSVSVQGPTLRAVPVASHLYESRVQACCGFHGCFCHGLGGHVQWACSIGSVDGTSTALAHQLPRVVSGTSCAGPPQRAATWQAHADPYGHTATVAYINRQGGLRSRRMWQLARHLLLWSQKYLRSLRAIHIPGVLNRAADKLSRQPALPGEWRLHPQVVQLIWSLFGAAQ